MSRHEFPHPFHGALVQELQDFTVAMGIGEPGPEIGFRNAVQTADAPLFLLQRVREARPENGVQDHGNEEQAARNRQ